ncbi:MAG: hypothetical protein ABFC96_13920 [Thermoguttaceae bacterium]
MRRSRWLARLTRDWLLAFRTLLLSLRTLFRLRSQVGIWQLPFRGSAARTPGNLDAFWIEPGATCMAFLDDFAKVAAEAGVVDTINVVFPTFNAEEAARYGLRWNPLPLPLRTAGALYLRGTMSRRREVAELLAGEKSSEILRLCQTMRRFWKTRVAGDAEDIVWEGIFPRILSERPTLAFVHHRIGRIIGGFSRAVKSRANVRTIYIQHGVSPQVCCPILHDEFWLMLPEERAYLQELGVDRPIRMVNRNKQWILNCLASGACKCNEAKKVLLLAQHPLGGTPLTAEYVYRNLDRLAAVAERLGWECLVRPHPRIPQIDGFERLLSQHPCLRLLDSRCPLGEQLRKERPAIAATFFSTSMVDAIGAGALPILLQAGLESITERTSCDYDRYGVVFAEDENMPDRLRAVMMNEEYRDEQYIRLRDNLRHLVTQAESVDDAYAALLKSVSAHCCDDAAP